MKRGHEKNPIWREKLFLALVEYIFFLKMHTIKVMGGMAAEPQKNSSFSYVILFYVLIHFSFDTLNTLLERAFIESTLTFYFAQDIWKEGKYKNRLRNMENLGKA